MFSSVARRHGFDDCSMTTGPEENLAKTVRCRGGVGASRTDAPGDRRLPGSRSPGARKHEGVRAPRRELEEGPQSAFVFEPTPG